MTGLAYILRDLDLNRRSIAFKCLWNYVELFWNSLDNAPSSIAFYLEMKVEVEVDVHNIKFTPRLKRRYAYILGNIS